MIKYFFIAYVPTAKPVEEPTQPERQETYIKPVEAKRKLMDDDADEDDYVPFGGSASEVVEKKQPEY